MNNPLTEGTRIILGYDYFAKGFSPQELNDAYYRLIANKNLEPLLFETASLCEIEEVYNPGEEEADREETILEAIRVQKFARAESKMLALVRVFNNYLKDKGISALAPLVGKPKKAGLFSTVTVQIPFDDGQVVSIIFHSPEGNKMKIAPDDEIIAFRWLLNKRDITQAVSPEADAEVSLQEIGKRVAMLAEKNAARFARMQKDIKEQREALETLTGAVEDAKKTNMDLIDTAKTNQEAAESLDRQIANLKDRIGKAKDINEKLQAQIEAVKAQQAANEGLAVGGVTPLTDEEMKRAQELDAYEEQRAAFGSELTGRGFVENSGQDMFWNREDFGSVRVDGYAITVEHIDEDRKTFSSATLAGLDRQISNALAWIDKKIASMKKGEASRVAAKPDLTDYQKEREGRDKEIDESNRLLAVGNAAVPGIRLQEAEEAGKLWEMKERGELTQKEWDTYVADLKASNKIAAGTGGDPIESVIDEELTPIPDPPEESPAVTILNDILAGKFGTSQEISDKLDEAAAELEAAGLLELYDSLLNNAADYLTEILRKEAA